MDYKYIRAWGRSLGSFKYYIDGEVEKARGDNAPQNAIYRGQDGIWVTYDDIQRDDTKERLDDLVRLMERKKT